jgi:hypothetical protein
MDAQLERQAEMTLEIAQARADASGTKVFELVEVFDLLGQSEDVCLVTVLKRSNSLGKILDLLQGPNGCST